jgi:hypothetical protein
MYYLCDALVWTSVFDDLGVDCHIDAQRSYSVEHVLSVVRRIRPYRSVAALGENDFLFQSYLITHLVFVASSWGGSSWGALPLLRALFADELVYLLGHTATAIAMNDPEVLASAWVSWCTCFSAYHVGYYS